MSPCDDPALTSEFCSVRVEAAVLGCDNRSVTDSPNR